jgi:predicted aconitase with swiveling domain
MNVGIAGGELLVLDAPLSFWGGVEPSISTITDRHHPQHGTKVGGRVLAMKESRGSSSSSSVLAEMIRLGTTPAAILIAASDPVLTIAGVVAAELYDRRVPILLLSEADFSALPRDRCIAEVAAEGPRAEIRLHLVVGGSSFSTGATTEARRRRRSSSP